MPGSFKPCATLDVSLSGSQRVVLKCGVGEILIGRSSQCDLLLPDQSVSRKHSRIVGTNHGFFIEDLSRYGTFINGRKISRETLVSDSEIKIGPYLLYFRLLSSTSEISEEPPTSKLSTRTDKDQDRKGNETFRAQPGNIESIQIVGKSKAINKILDLMNKVACKDLPVMITGETGTGKELVARGIHILGPRNSNIFVAVNCSAISKELVESELFGHEKGAFTGASSQKKGAFEVASRGTLFLDEIGEMPLAAQSKLLRAIEESEIVRVGNTTPLKIDVRIVAATNKILENEVEAGNFRKDLYYRLNAFPIHIPALRERSKDINLLIDFFLDSYNSRYGTIKNISRSAAAILERYPWPGNARELKNLIFRAAILCQGDEIDDDIISEILPDIVSQPTMDGKNNFHLTHMRKIDRAERDAIINELKNTQWNKTQAAKNLGISKSTLFDKLKKYRIDSH